MLWQIACQCPGLSNSSLLLIVACSGVCWFQMLHYCSLSYCTGHCKLFWKHVNHLLRLGEPLASFLDVEVDWHTNRFLTQEPGDSCCAKVKIGATVGSRSFGTAGRGSCICSVIFVSAQVLFGPSGCSCKYWVNFS